MTALATLVLLGFVPAALLLFTLLRPAVAALVVLTAGSLFLPNTTFALPGPLDLGKPEAISFALFFGVLLFDAGRIATIRLCASDLLLLGALACGSASSIANDLGGYDAFAIFLTRFVKVAVPFLIGAIYFASHDGLRRVVWALFLSGLVYAPLCLYEVRMSPQLHAQVYGFAQHSFEQTMRGGGFRPMVFMSHGLELSLWMAAATVAGVVLWRSGAPRRVQGVPFAWLVGGLAATTVLCKSTGAILLGLLAFVGTTAFARRWLGAALLLFVPVYIGTRMFADGALETLFVDAARMVSEERALSLQFRFENETILLHKLRAFPWFGAGGWNFGNVFDPETGMLVPVVTDSMWIIVVAMNGSFGLITTVGMLWLPALRALAVHAGTAAHRVPERLAACLILTMLILDTMINAFLPPIYYALAGGLARVPLRPGVSSWGGAEALEPSAPAAAAAKAATARPFGARRPIQPRHLADRS